MTIILQLRRGSTSESNALTGAEGELFVDLDKNTVVVHDGVQQGGFPLPTFSDITGTTVDQVARNTANTASNNITILQGVNTTQNTNITTATNLAQNAYNNSNTKFSSSGGQITGNVVIVGNLDVTNNTVISNAIEANNAIFDGTLLSGLAARTSVVLPHLIAQFASNSATYVQTNSQNINPEGSADWVVTADNGTDTDFYLDLGLHGSQAYDKILTPYDGYLFVQGSTIGQAGGNLVIGTTSSYPGLETKFVAGGYEANNLVMRIGTYGANIIGNLTVTNQIISPTTNAINSYAASAYAAANGANGLAQGAYNAANTNTTTITNTNNFAQSAYNAANTVAATIPQNRQSAGYTLQTSDAGKHLYYTNNSAVSLFIPWTANTSWANGTTITIISNTSSNVTVTPNTGVSLYLAGNTTSASRNVTTYGMATLIMTAANTWYINGTGVV